MAYVPGCRYDLFISYASENNCDGWVEEFEKALGQELNRLIGRKFAPKDSIFIDRRKLRVGQSFPDELARAARESAILLAVLSPSYLTSEWCGREWTNFFSRLPHGASEKDCLAPIQVAPLDGYALDPLLQNAQRFSFLSGDNRTLLPPRVPEWTARVGTLADQIKNALQELRLKCRPVFVGKAPERAQDLREKLLAELEERKLRTVPDGGWQVFNNVDAIAAHLKEAGLAVHFLGGADEISMQAMEVSATVGAGPIILYQPFGEILTGDEEIFLSGFEQNPARPYQKLQGKNAQELLALIDEQITRPPEGAAPSAGLRDLALVCGAADLNDVERIKETILALSRANIDLPSFLQRRMTASEKMREWREILTRSKRLLFYYGQEQKERLEPFWQKAERDNAAAPRNWFVAPPDLEGKRQQYPEALWSVEQVVALLQQTLQQAREAGQL